MACIFHYVNALRKIRKSVSWNFENTLLIGFEFSVSGKSRREEFKLSRERLEQLCSGFTTAFFHSIDNQLATKCCREANHLIVLSHNWLIEAAF